MKWNEVTFHFSARPTQGTSAGVADPSQIHSYDTPATICLKEGDVVQVANSPRAQFSPNNGSWSAHVTDDEQMYYHNAVDGTSHWELRSWYVAGIATVQTVMHVALDSTARTGPTQRCCE